MHLLQQHVSQTVWGMQLLEFGNMRTFGMLSTFYDDIDWPQSWTIDSEEYSVWHYSVLWLHVYWFFLGFINVKFKLIQEIRWSLCVLLLSVVHLQRQASDTHFYTPDSTLVLRSHITNSVWSSIECGYKGITPTVWPSPIVANRFPKVLRCFASARVIPVSQWWNTTEMRWPIAELHELSQTAGTECKFFVAQGTRYLVLNI